MIGDVRRPPPGRAAIAWGFAIYHGAGLGDAIRTRRGEFKVKMGVVVEGAESYTLSVPRAKLGKVSLNYTFRSFRRIARGATRVTFEPCPNRARTAWAGGLVLEHRRPVTLKVKRASGEVERIRVGRIRRSYRTVIAQWALDRRGYARAVHIGRRLHTWAPESGVQR